MHTGCDSRRDRLLRGRAEKNNVDGRLGLKTIGELRKSVGRPAFCRAIRSACSDGDSQAVGLDTVRTKKLRGALAILFRNVEADEGFVRQGIEPAGASK